MDSFKAFVFPADQVDINLLRCQQLRLYILKAGRALLSHQDKLRQILSQPAVAEIGPNPSGNTLYNLQRFGHNSFNGKLYALMTVSILKCYIFCIRIYLHYFVLCNFIVFVHSLLFHRKFKKKRVSGKSNEMSPVGLICNQVC